MHGLPTAPEGVGGLIEEPRGSGRIASHEHLRSRCRERAHTDLEHSSIRNSRCSAWKPCRASGFSFDRIIHGTEQECWPSAALSLYPEGPRVLFRISSSGPCAPAIVPQEAPIFGLLRRWAGRTDLLRDVKVGGAVV